MLGNANAPRVTKGQSLLAWPFGQSPTLRERSIAFLIHININNFFNFAKFLNLSKLKLSAISYQLSADEQSVLLNKISCSRSVANGQRPTANGQRPTANG
ncbi:hypothetical protein BJP34_24420 [Moorena producens PAL-8-15-08-1]|uniref:Uncharacterized protein n=1 Tax=Moorena producens PAL-8-15-08-1 TaxID=1458985 RepID=A0A1D8TXI4_9CYAN|nr:hypothetical protein BJP34_24420 [Moorena producens PAL-8-15-08-1]